MWLIKSLKGRVGEHCSCSSSRADQARWQRFQYQPREGRTSKIAKQKTFRSTEGKSSLMKITTILRHKHICEEHKSI